MPLEKIDEVDCESGATSLGNSNLSINFFPSHFINFALDKKVNRGESCIHVQEEHQYEKEEEPTDLSDLIENRCHGQNLEMLITNLRSSTKEKHDENNIDAKNLEKELPTKISPKVSTCSNSLSAKYSFEDDCQSIQNSDERSGREEAKIPINSRESLQEQCIAGQDELGTSLPQNG